ncbi:hypothetical protein Bca4012_031242 [Brassica carinata]
MHCISHQIWSIELTSPHLNLQIYLAQAPKSRRSQLQSQLHSVTGVGFVGTHVPSASTGMSRSPPLKTQNLAALNFNLKSLRHRRLSFSSNHTFGHDGVRLSKT